MSPSFLDVQAGPEGPGIASQVQKGSKLPLSTLSSCENSHNKEYCKPAMQTNLGARVALLWKLINFYYTHFMQHIVSFSFYSVLLYISEIKEET